MILAGDIGGTNARLALFGDRTVQPIRLATYPTAGGGLVEIVGDFLRGDRGVVGACIGLAGTVVGGRANGVNLPWPVDPDEFEHALDIPLVLVNDLHANARGIDVLDESDFAVLQQGERAAAGNRAVVSAGTGLGEAGLFWDGSRHYAIASEGGHADFAPRSDLEIALYRYLAANLGHVSYERVCSGAGLVNIYRFLSRNGADAPDAATISTEALADPSSLSSRALDLFVSIYGARAGNVALGFMARGGVFLGGGIPPKIVERLQAGPFLEAFLAKGRFRTLLEQIPVRVILNDRTALLGAARIGAERFSVPFPDPLRCS